MLAYLTRWNQWNLRLKRGGKSVAKIFKSIEARRAAVRKSQLFQRWNMLKEMALMLVVQDYDRGTLYNNSTLFEYSNKSATAFYHQKRLSSGGYGINEGTAALTAKKVTLKSSIVPHDREARLLALIFGKM